MKTTSKERSEVLGLFYKLKDESAKQSFEHYVPQNNLLNKWVEVKSNFKEIVEHFGEEPKLYMVYVKEVKSIVGSKKKFTKK